MQHVVIVSLAAALALPFFTDTMAPFSRRDLPVFLAFAVIVMTLVVQGPTLKPLIRALKIGGGRRADFRWHDAVHGDPGTGRGPVVSFPQIGLWLPPVTYK